MAIAGDVNENRGEALAAELGEMGAAFVRCDVLCWEDQLKLFKTALMKSPSRSVDIVVANAGRIPVVLKTVSALALTPYSQYRSRRRRHHPQTEAPDRRRRSHRTSSKYPQHQPHRRSIHCPSRELLLSQAAKARPQSDHHGQSL